MRDPGAEGAETPSRDARETARIEAFSDGVFAIAITLLVLDLHVPGPADTGPLGSWLAAQWPSYLAFVNSFATIGIMWINHHRLFTLIRRADHTLLILNGLLLLGVTVVPFPTALLASALHRPDARVAALVYAGTFTAIAIVFNLLWHYSATGGRLLDPRVNPRAVRAITRAYALGPLVYGLAWCLAFVSVAARVGLTVALAVYFALPSRPAPGD